MEEKERTPTLTDFHLMQIAMEIRAIQYMLAGKKTRLQLSEFMFNTDNPKQMSTEEKSVVAKQLWKARLANK